MEKDFIISLSLSKSEAVISLSDETLQILVNYIGKNYIDMFINYCYISRLIVIEYAKRTEEKQ